jgi:DnaA family protein
MRQLTLPLQLQDNANFANFFAGENQLLLDYLKQFIRGQHDYYLYLWGHSGVGCSHLLQACCQDALEQGLTAVYIPLAYIKDFKASMLVGLETVSLVCLDDIQNIAANTEWEEAVFHLYNRIMTAQNHLLIAGHSVPAELNIQLPDLSSRLASGVVTQIQTLTDEEKIMALQMRAKLRGFDLPHEVAEFLLHRFPRNFSILFDALEKMDKASLSAQRKLTVPFIKKVLQI